MSTTVRELATARQAVAVLRDAITALKVEMANSPQGKTLENLAADLIGAREQEMALQPELA